MKTLLVVLLLLVGCSQTQNDPYTVSLNGKVLSLNQAYIAEDYGEPLAFYEQVSCGYEGMDRIYTYASFVVYTYPDANGIDRVLEIEFNESGKTIDGIGFVSSLEDMITVFGEISEESQSLVRFDANASILLVTVQDNEITGMSLIYEP